MLDMGFRRPSTASWPAAARPPDALFSATLDGEAGRIAAEYTRDARRHEHSRRARRDAVDIQHRFLAVAHEDKLDSLVECCAATTRGRTLVFVRTKRGADRLVKRLAARRRGRRHARRQVPVAAREGARRFRNGDVAALVATDVAARGIDVDDITHVINFDAPEDREATSTASAAPAAPGRTGVGVTFVMHDQAHDIGKIAPRAEAARRSSRRAA